MRKMSPEWLDALAADLDEFPEMIERNAALREEIDLAPERLMVASLPWAGGEWVARVLIHALEAQRLHLCAGYGHHEQALSLPRMVRSIGRHGVANHHLRANQTNLNLIRIFHMKTIILTRSLYDIVRCMLADEERPSAAESLVHLPSFWRDLRSKERTDLLIDQVVPWCMQFHSSWQVAFTNDTVPAVWATWEDLTANPEQSFGELLRCLGHSQAIAHLPAALATHPIPEAAPKRRLQKAHSERIRSIAEHYRDQDLYLLGLEDPNAA